MVLRNMYKFFERLYFKLLMKFPFLPQNPIASVYRIAGVSDYKRVYSYTEPKTPDKTIRKIMQMAWKGKFKIRPGTTPLQLETILEQIKATNDIEGDIIELGTYKGGTAIHMAKYLDITGDSRKMYLCDTFNGFPYDDEYSKTVFAKKGYLSDTSSEKVIKLFTKNNLERNVKLIEGKFEDTLEQQLSNEIFSFAFIDCDLFQSGIAAIEFISKHLAKGGIICIHDYDTEWGMSRAIKDFENKFPKFHMIDVVSTLGIMTVDE
jgi:predicted O-methyltransferase YrrM